jgi:hypothetical protein
MIDRSQFALAVGHADVITDSSFHGSIEYFHTAGIDRGYWKDVRELAGIEKPLTLGDHNFIVVDGDITAELTTAECTALIVYGDVRATIRTKNHCEIVIAGDVFEEAIFETDGIFHLFVGGDFAGSLKNQGWCTAWVEGNMRGQVLTGQTSCDLRVCGDFAASIRPTAKASLLSLAVKGFAPYHVLESAAAYKYTVFNASIGTSDRPAGLYPDKKTTQELQNQRRYNRWAILRNRS